MSRGKKRMGGLEREAFFVFGVASRLRCVLPRVFLDGSFWKARMETKKYQMEMEYGLERTGNGLSTGETRWGIWWLRDCNSNRISLLVLIFWCTA